MTILKLQVVSGTIQFIRKQLSASELYPVNQRWNDTEGVVQYTPDGGATWIDAPELDPRYQTNVPPRAGSDKNCQGAASAIEYVRRFVDLVVPLITAASTLVQGATAILGFLGILGGWGILWEIIAGSFATLTGYGAATISAAMTEDVYEQLTCIVYCHMDGNGQLDATAFGLVQSEVTSEIGGTAALIINLILELMGFAGVNRAATFYDLDYDCDSCGCGWCYNFDFEANDGSWTTPTDSQGPQAAYSVGNGWQSVKHKNPSFNQWSTLSFIQRSMSARTVTRIEVEFDYTRGSFDDSSRPWFTISDQSATVVNLVTSEGSGSFTKVWTGSRSMTQIQTYARCGYKTTNTQSGSATIRRVTVWGNGTNPFGSDNCT